jgi:opacity protein-like surface antigen
MKKLLILATTLLVCGAIQAQGSKEKIGGKSFLALHAGPSFPVGDFSNNSFDVTQGFLGSGGFAKTGFNINLNYGYEFVESFGLTASAFYNNNKLDNKAFVDQLNAIYGGEFDFTGVKMDHWSWYGLTVGPALLHNITPNVGVDLRVMGGIANANSPRLKYQGATIMDEDWSIAGVFQGGANLRINVGQNMFIYTGVDYQYMKPKFNISYEDPDTGEMITENAKQKISVVNVTGGFGIRF